MVDVIDICGLVVAALALVVAAVAVWIAWDLRRKTTTHVFGLIEAASGYTNSIEHPSGFCHFEIYLKNLGLPFPQMSIVLGFREKNGKGWLCCPLRARDIRTKASSENAVNVATGLVVEFGWRSYETSNSDRRVLLSLESVREQEAVLSVYCNGYIVSTLNLDSTVGSIRRRWQSAAFGIFRRLELGLYAKNQQSWRARVKLPDVQLVSASLTYFLDCLRKEQSSSKSHAGDA